MVVPITDIVKMTLSVADISVEPIIGTPLLYIYISHIVASNLLLAFDGFHHKCMHGFF